MRIFINPGSGPVPGATDADAFVNIKKLAEDIGERYGVRVPGILRAEELDDGGGRFGYKLLMADGRIVEVEMPGLSIEQVRYVNPKEQNIWDFPRLYIDGGSWVWKYAVEACGEVAE